MANIKQITLVKTFGHYKAGDGLQLEEKEATTLVNAGFAVFSEK